MTLTVRNENTECHASGAGVAGRAFSRGLSESVALVVPAVTHRWLQCKLERRKSPRTRTKQTWVASGTVVDGSKKK